MSSRLIVKCKRQTPQGKRQAMWTENHLTSTAKFLSLNKVSVCSSFGPFNQSGVSIFEFLFSIAVHAVPYPQNKMNPIRLCLFLHTPVPEGLQSCKGA